MKNILFIDNRDSFAYNVIELLRQLNAEVIIIEDSATSPNVSENYVLDKLLTAYKSINTNATNSITVTHILNSFDGIVLSPGAGIPCEYSIMQTILNTEIKTPILGICLGHQAIAEAAGAKLKQIPKPMHGHTSHLIITKPKHSIFENLPNKTNIGRYHSWVIDNSNIPTTLELIAYDEEGNIQAIAHKVKHQIGLQFHPESIITSYGKQIISNWLSYIDKNQ